MDFKSKYLQYKFKYILSKNFSGGSSKTPYIPKKSKPEYYVSPTGDSVSDWHFSDPRKNISPSPKTTQFNPLDMTNSPLGREDERKKQHWFEYDKHLKKSKENPVKQPPHFQQVPIGEPKLTMPKFVLGLPEKPLKIQNRIKEINDLITNPQILEALSEKEISKLIAETAELTNQLNKILSTEDLPDSWENNYDETVKLINEMQKRDRERKSGRYDKKDTTGTAHYDWVVTPPSPPADRPIKLSDKDSEFIQELYRLKNMRSNTNELQRETQNQQIIDFIDENIHKINNKVKELFHNTRDEIYKEQQELLSKLNQQSENPANNAFRQVDLNGDRFLSQSEFEEALPKEETVTQPKPLFDHVAVKNSTPLWHLVQSDKKPSPPKEDNSAYRSFLSEELENDGRDLLTSLQRQTPPKEDICKFQPCSVQGGNKKKYGVYKDKLVELIQKHTDSVKPYYTIKVNDIEKQVDSLSELN